MPLGHLEVEYLINIRELEGSRVRQRLVHATKIGRFAVRDTRETPDVAESNSGEHFKQWNVEHIPTGCMIATFDTFEDAVIVADDMSRFSKRDPSSKDMARAVAQMGPKIRGYVAALRNTGKVFGYREWDKGEH